MSVNRGCRIVAALCVLFLGGSLAGCSLLGSSKVSSDDIRAMKNIPEGQKNTLISRMEAASSASERAEIGQQAVTLNKMIGTKLLMKEPPIAYQRTYELKSDGTVEADKNDYAYLYMSAADYWRLGEDGYELCVDQGCEYYSEWTVEVEKGYGGAEYVWTLTIDDEAQVDGAPLVRRFQAAK